MQSRKIAVVVAVGSVAFGNACGGAGSPAELGPDAATAVDGPAETGCAAGLAGAPCVIALYDAAAGCEADAVAKLRAELDARAALGPLWANGRALFRTDAPTRVAGTFNDWDPTALATAPFCGTELNLAAASVPTGFHQYKLTDGAIWSLDPRDPAFAYDDFSGNADGANSVLDTPDSGLGHLVHLQQACSTALNNCRGVTAYLPPGYDSPGAAQTTYPVLFLHDGQNVWDDHDCCFGHTGWEVNVTLDQEIAAHEVAPIIVIAGDNTASRNDEYGLDAATSAAFIHFQVAELQPQALAQVRWDRQPVAIGGSSLGGLIAMRGALENPTAYRGVAALSASFWVGQDTSTAMRDELHTVGKQPVSIYLDHGGMASDDSDSAADAIEVRDELVSLGWQRGNSPACAVGPNALCYFTQPGATHDELAWKARAWRFLEFLFPAS